MLGLGTGIHYSGAPSEFGLGDVGRLSLWYKNNTDITTAQWNDQSGNNRHAVPVNESNLAAVSEGGFDFEEGESDCYEFSPEIVVAAEAGFSLAVVMHTESSTNNTLFSDTNNETLSFQNVNIFRVLTNTPSNTTSKFYKSGTYSTNKMVVLVNRTAGASGEYSIFKNGTAVAYEASSGASTLADAGENTGGFTLDTFGARSAGPDHFFDGKIYEIAFWNSELTATEITKVNDYLKDKHGL
jgi:hypothetical protein